MKIILAMYLKGGRAVSYYKGDPKQEAVLSHNPFGVIKKFTSKGLTAIHIVDMDGSHLAFANRVLKETNLRLSYADGITSIAQVDALFSAGVHYVSLDQFSEPLLPEALNKYGPEKIFFTIRTQKQITEDRPGLEVMDYGQDLVSRGIANIILRDMKAEGTFHPNFDEVERLVIGTKANVFAFGGIGNMEDVEILARAGAAGVMISRAFFEGKI